MFTDDNVFTNIGIQEEKQEGYNYNLKDYCSLEYVFRHKTLNANQHLY